MNIFEEENWIVFEIIDKGIGMPPETLDKIFTLEGLKSRHGTSAEKALVLE